MIVTPRQEVASFPCAAVTSRRVFYSQKHGCEGGRIRGIAKFKQCDSKEFVNGQVVRCDLQDGHLRKHQHLFLSGAMIEW